MKIAIIGMGVAGVSVLSAMTKHPIFQKHEIILFDKPQTFGTGLPYQPDSSIILLNQTADTMSMEQNDRLDFVRWVEKHKGYHHCEKEHLPRPWYGEYVREKLEKAIAILKPEVREEYVTDISLQKDGTFLVSSESNQEQFDLVHLCIGHLPYLDPYKLIGNARFIYHPYPVKETLAQIPDEATIGIIGTGLTAIDILRFFKHQKRNKNIHFFSDTGTFSTLRGVEPDLRLRYLNKQRLRDEKERNNGFVSLGKMLEWFELECEDKEIDARRMVELYGKGTKQQLENQLIDEGKLGVLQSIIHHMDEDLPDFWNSLTEKDKIVFMEKYRSTFEVIRSPIPREAIEELIAWWKNGELSVRGGMKSVEEQADDFIVHFDQETSMKVDYLVNATGQMLNVSISPYQSDILNNLLNQRVIQPEKFGGVQVHWPTSEPVSQRYGLVEQLYLHGQLITGVQYGNNTAGMLRDHAHDVVERIASRIKN